MHQAWNVYLNGEKIDTVFFDDDLDKDYVLDSLINHDNYDSNINVRRWNMDKKSSKPRCKYIVTADPKKMGIAYPDFGFKKKTIHSKEKADFYKVRGFDVAKVCRKPKKRK